MASPKDNSANATGDDEDDDYMNMTFEEPALKNESSIQRTQRLKRESQARGVVKSKAQRAEEEAAAREKALSTSLLDDPRAKKSKGLAMMAKMGFSGGGLGKKMEEGDTAGRAEPIKVSIKEDRGGVGLDSEKKRRLEEAVDARGIKVAKVEPEEYRERVRKEREEAKLEAQFRAAQRVAERLDEEKVSGAASDGPSSPTESAPESKSKPISSKPLKSICLLYRGLVRQREEQERDRRMRHDLEQSLSRLPTYEEDDEDDDYKKALGKKQTVYVTAEDLDEEDEELDRFNALGAGERLHKVVEYLRWEHRYCFWCKMAYPDEDMDGCPGLTEEDHD
ncbi:G patch domain-containing protein 11 [Tolypocladium ophioglossoides CBS 100239]|uniref:G patch domain-containing protein 11 n=1 Tax=Tolypocladium ophioglossoides (strain CBS 100239) TaxID=1163406 RepID=A0A0L0NLJ2_TOLOC|nr:G patch domain-containing protein 11 [Tolypocladium ophioglossoides CBS 100239]